MNKDDHNKVADESAKAGVSRRYFLGITGLGAVTLASGALLGACSKGQKSDSANNAAANPDEGGATIEVSADKGYDLYETDLVIVGAGNAVSSAAWFALRGGVTRVIMIEKGPRQQSGHTNTTWGGFSVYTDIAPEIPLDEWQAPFLGKPWSEYLVNTPLTRNAFDLYKEGARDYDKRNRGVTMINYGQYIPSRDENGTIIPLAGSMCLWQWYRHDLDGVVAKDAIEVLDKTMVTDFIVQDGTCCGVIALHIPTGRMRIVRSKAVIAATSGVGINYGRLPVHAVSAGSPDSTFDLEYSL